MKKELERTELINIDIFFKEKGIVFETQKQGIRWLKRNLNPIICLKIGPNYLVEKKEIQKLFQAYILNKRKKEIKKSEKK